MSRSAQQPPVPVVRQALVALAVLVAVGVAQAGDLLTFLRMVSISGIEAELNPLVAHVAETAGVGVLAVAKIALVILVVAVFAVVARTRHRVAAAVATFGTLAGLVGAFSNVLAIV